jgi:hypothetical protein
MNEQHSYSRRRFIGGTLAATAATTLFGAIAGGADDKPAPSVCKATA